VTPARDRRGRTTSIAAVAVAALVLSFTASRAHAQAPWEGAEQVRTSLFDAQSALLLDRRNARSEVERARRALNGDLARGLLADAPAAFRTLTAALERAEAAAGRGDETALAAARGTALAALRAGAYEVTVRATRRGNVAEARRWLLIRDFRQATRFTRPGVDATAALDGLAAGEIDANAAVLGVRKDLLDAYQARLISYLDDALQARDRDFGPALAENAALAAGYWPILAPEYERQRGRAERERLERTFASLARTAAAGDGQAFEAVRERALGALDGFTAAPFTPEEQARRAQQLIRFLDLIPIEYDDGTEDDRVTIPFEIQEGVAFLEGAESALNDLESTLLERDPQAVDAIEAAFERLDGYLTEANEGGSVAPLEDVEAAHDEASDALDASFPDEWKESSTEADFDLVDISLDQMQAAAGAGEKQQAEQARLSAYGFFEFGPEPLLRALDPQLVAEIEGLVWYGARGKQGLGELIASEASVQDIRETRLELDEALEEARAITGEGASDTTVITNAALIVFREGLEAILIVAAITASMVGGNRPLRKPIYRGTLLAIPATAILFLLAQTLLDSLSRYGEKLEAVVGLVAIGVLLLVLNWFFHRVYWTEWIAGHRRRGMALAGAGTAGATVLGLYLLGFSSVFREGFEIVLFLQALALNSGTGVVLAGVSLGLAMTAAVGVLTFALERRLPYKRMLIVTGVMISLVLVVLVGNTVRTMQGVGWLPITPVDVEFPLWMGTWLGVFPTVETLLAQAGAFAFVIGSYFLAEVVRKRKLSRASDALVGRVAHGADEGEDEHEDDRERREREHVHAVLDRDGDGHEREETAEDEAAEQQGGAKTRVHQRA
jgi:high-affinity iron transporter